MLWISEVTCEAEISPNAIPASSSGYCASKIAILDAHSHKSSTVVRPGRVRRYFLSLFVKPFIKFSFTLLTRSSEQSLAATAGSPAPAPFAAIYGRVRLARSCNSV